MDWTDNVRYNYLIEIRSITRGYISLRTVTNLTINSHIISFDYL